jgi:hypothetical protein
MAEDSRSLQEILTTAFSQFGTLVRSELELGKAEVRSIVGSAAAVLPLLGVALALFTASLVLLLMAVSAWFESLGMSGASAPLLAGILGIAVSGILGWAGSNKLRSEHLLPTRTAEQVERDAAAIRERLK